MFVSNTDSNNQEYAPRNEIIQQAAEWFYSGTTPQILSSETLKTIQEFLNNGFVDRMKSVRVHLILHQTVLIAKKKVQLFLMDEPK